MGKVALLGKNPLTKKHAAFDPVSGLMLCQSDNKERVIMLIESGLCPKAKHLGFTSVSTKPSANGAAHFQNAPVSATMRETPVEAEVEDEELVEPKPHFDANERFEFLSSFTDMVIARQIPSLLVTGDAGLGKSYTVQARFKAAGLRDSTEFLDMLDKDDPTDSITNYGDYVTVKGFSTARGLFRTLFQNRERNVIFDDCDKVLDDKVAVNLLKSALDSHDRRVLTWNAESSFASEEDRLPKTFEFKGGVIFISNKTQDRIDGAIKSRCMRVDLAMTAQERIARIAHVMPYMCTDIDMSKRREALKFLEEHMGVCTDLNFRTFISVAKLVDSSPSNWRKMALYTVSA